MPWPDTVTLSGKRAKLVTLDMAHADELREAVHDGELWKLWYTAIPAPERMEHEIERRLHLRELGTMLPFAVLDQTTGKAIGMTTYMNIEPTTPRLEIGSTWYRSSAQRSGINTECKLMLLTHAFEILQCTAVEFRTSSFNRQSRAAIERLGAKLDGILRNHQHYANGTMRDTYVYSIIDSEWPTVKAHLEFQLNERGLR